MGDRGHSLHAQAVYDAYSEHASGTRIHTDSAVQIALLKQYPDHCLSATKSDLIKYAHAGYATATLAHDGPPNVLSRDYEPARRVSTEDSAAGVLKDAVVFARYNYAWQSHTFHVYVVDGQNSLNPGQCDRRSYVLSKSAQSEIAGQTASVAADALILAASIWAEKSDEEVWVFDQGRWVKDRALWVSVQESSFEGVILEEKMKTGIARDVMGFFDARKQYAEFGTPWKRGLIFHGPPGNGKTMTIKAVIRTLMSRPDSIPTLYVKTLAERSFGPQWSVRLIFTKARQTAPCLLLFEDIDSLVTDEVRSYFLNEVDGLESNDGILMIGSTNNLEKLDIGLSKRPSRFDRKYRFNTPSFDDRVRYCEHWSEKLLTSSTAAMSPAVPQHIASITEGFSYAYIKEAIVSCLLTIVHEPAGNSLFVEMANDRRLGLLGSLLEKQVALLRVEMGETES